MHLGHEHIIRTVSQQLTPQKTHIIPCHIPPHKAQFHVDNLHRLAMLHKAFDGASSDVNIDTREIESQSVSYTVDTVTALRQELGEAVSLSFVVGEDSWLNFFRWYCWREILTKVNLVVVTRRGEWQVSGRDSDREELHAYRELHEVPMVSLNDYAYGKIVKLPMAAVDIASNTIRHCIAMGLSINEMVSPSVASYIHEHGLYR